MSDRKNFFHIEADSLPKNSVLFPFHIYIFNPFNKQYTKFLHANSPLVDEKKTDLEMAINKGAVLAISKGQKNTFLRETGLEEEDIPDLREKPVHELIQKREEQVKEINNKNLVQDGDFILKKEIRNAIENNNFEKLLEKVRDEIMLFPVTSSPTVSLSRELAIRLLTEDNETNRVVILSYLLANITGINSPMELGDLVCAAFLHHIGLGQLPPFYSNTPYIKLSGKDKDRLKKHPGLAQHLIKKCGLEIGPRAQRIILEHHERADGSGYPFSLKINKIDPLSLILGACSHVIEYSEGRISGSKTPLRTVLQFIKNKSMPSGLEFEFGPIIYSNLTSFIDSPINPLSQEKP